MYANNGLDPVSSLMTILSDDRVDQETVEQFIAEQPDDDSNKDLYRCIWQWHQLFADQEKDQRIQLNKTLALLRQAQHCMPYDDDFVKPSLMFFGETRVGKSTFINYLMNTRYQTERKGLRYHAARVPDSEPELARVGRTRVSETFLPSIYSRAEHPYALIDISGFEDNRDTGDGATLNPYEVVSGVIIRMLSEKLQRLQGLVLIVPINHITSDNIRDIAAPARRFVNLCSHLTDEELKNAFIGITKTNLTGAPDPSSIAIELRDLIEPIKATVASEQEKRAVERVLTSILGNSEESQHRVFIADVTDEAAREEHYERFSALRPISASRCRFMDVNPHVGYFAHFLDAIKSNRARAHSNHDALVDNREQLFEDIKGTRDAFNAIVQQCAIRDIPSFAKEADGNSLSALLKSIAPKQEAILTVTEEMDTFDRSLRQLQVLNQRKLELNKRIEEAKLDCRAIDILIEPLAIFDEVINNSGPEPASRTAPAHARVFTQATETAETTSPHPRL